MNYTIEYIDLGDGDKIKCYVFKEDNGVLGIFINGDAHAFRDSICKQLNLVLQGKKKTIESFGNECSWLIRPDFTFIKDNFALDDNSREMVIDTQELYSLINECYNEPT